MGNLINKIFLTGMIGAGSLGIFGNNGYGQDTIEKTKNGFKKYNEKGQVIQECEFNGKNKTCNEYKYNEQGKIIETKWQKEENGRILDCMCRTNYEYDMQGKLVGKKIGFGKQDTTIFYLYDEKGREIGELSRFQDDSLEFSYDYKYDEKGRKIGEKYQSSNNQGINLISIDEWKYDGQGRIIEKKHKAQKKGGYNYQAYESYKYNEGTLIKKTHCDLDGDGVFESRF